MKQLTNSQLSELRETYRFYCDMNSTFNAPMDIQKENELVLKLIENAILTKKAEKRRKAKLKMALWRKI